MKLLKISGLVFSIAVIVSCVPMRRMPEMKLPPEPIALSDYYFTPLNERGWVEIGENAYNVALVKQGKEKDETYAIQTMRFKLPAFKNQADFVRLIKSGQAADTSSTRFTVIKHDVTDYTRLKSNCAISNMVTKDHNAIKRSGKTGDMILEALVLTCALPKDKSTGIGVVYSHRYYPGHNDSDFAEKGMTVLSSVKFQ